MTAKIGIVCGLASEAKIARRAILAEQDITVLVSGASSERAYAAAAELAAEGIEVLVSFGVSGGLSARLEPGAIILGDSVMASNGTIAEAPRALVERLTNTANKGGLEVAKGRVAGVDRIVRQPAQKHILAERSGAIAVDMESHAVAKAAMEHGTAFAILRVIADPASGAIPEAALSMIGPNGRVGPFRAARAILGRPQDLPGLVRLGRQNSAALKSLGRAAEVFFPALR